MDICRFGTKLPHIINESLLKTRKHLNISANIQLVDSALCIGSKYMVILLKVWILPVGEFASVDQGSAHKLRSRLVFRLLPPSQFTVSHALLHNTLLHHITSGLERRNDPRCGTCGNIHLIPKPLDNTVTLLLHYSSLHCATIQFITLNCTTQICSLLNCYKRQ